MMDVEPDPDDWVDLTRFFAEVELSWNDRVDLILLDADWWPYLFLDERA